jgi:hypothetical protein
MTRKTQNGPARDAAHTEVRRQGQAEEGKPHLKPRTPPEKLPEAGEDGPDDLFNDMPV